MLILHCQRETGTACVCVSLCVCVRESETLSARPRMASTCLCENSVAKMQFCVSTNLITC